MKLYSIKNDGFHLFNINNISKILNTYQNEDGIINIKEYITNEKN